MINFNTMKTEVIARLGNRTDIDARVDRWINYAFFELLVNPRFSFFELDGKLTFPTVVGQSTYAVDLIPNLWFILDIRDVTNIRKLQRSHWQVLDRVTPTSGQPTRYARFGNGVELDPIPDGVYTLQIRFRVRPVDLTANSTFDPLGTEWEEIIVTASTIRGFEALDQRDKATEQRQILEALMPTHEDRNQLEDMDAETTVAPVLRYRY